MPRDVNGNYTLPAGNPVVTDTIITSVWGNTTMGDLGAEMGDSLSRSGKGSMTATLGLANLGYAFAGEPTTGRYLAGVGDMRDKVLGVDAAFYTNQGQVVTATGTPTATALVARFASIHVDVKTDYEAVGDGVADDTIPIQTALTNHSHVYFPPGTYLTTAQISLTRDDQFVYGAGRASKLKTTADIDIFRIGENGQPVNRVTVSDLSFEGSKPTLNDGLRCVEVFDSSFRNLHFKDFGHDGFLIIKGCIGNSIVQCHVDGSGDDGFNIGGDAAGSSQDNTIVGCIAENCTNDGIHVSDASLRTSVVGNVCRNNGNGVGLFNANNVSIVGNTLIDNTTYGVYTPSGPSSYVSISGNNIRGGSRGIHIQEGLNYSIIGNTIDNCTTYGISLSRTDQAALETAIVGNSIDNGCTEAGIFLNGVSTVTVTGNSIADVTGDGIFINSNNAANACFDILVANNTIKDAGDEGIFVASGNFSEYISILGNHVRSAVQIGIEYRGGRYFSIQNNRVTNATTRGILISAGALQDGKGLVCGNTVQEGCTGGGLRVSNYNDVLVSHNAVFDITGTNGLDMGTGTITNTANITNAVSSTPNAGFLSVVAPNASTLGAVVKRVEVFDKDGASVGFVPVYDAIT